MKNLKNFINHSPFRGLGGLPPFRGLGVLFLLAILTATAHTVTDEGAWCWFADPRAMHYVSADSTINMTYIGYIDTHGRIKAMQYDHRRAQQTEVLVRSYFQPDDHDSPTFLALPDGRIMIFYSRHTDEPCFYYRISTQPGDITTLGAEHTIATDHNTTYPSPFILSDDPDHIYLCWRGINWHPTIARLSLPDHKGNVAVVDGPYQIVQSTGARPYAKYVSDGKNRIWMAYTTGHPDNEYPNYLHCNYIDINDMTLRDFRGDVCTDITVEPLQIDKSDAFVAAHPSMTVDASPCRDWVWQMVLDTDGMPVIAMTRISEDKKEHDYYIARLSDGKWQKTLVAHGGGHFHQSPDIEHCYSGGMAIDPENTSVVYCSVPVDGTYEIARYMVDEAAASPPSLVTSHSTAGNIRPYVIPDSQNSPIRLVWMQGDYYDWIVSNERPQGFCTAIEADFEGYADTECIRSDLDETRTYLGVDIIIDINGKPLVYSVDAETLKPQIDYCGSRYKSANALANADGWRQQPRATDGKWHAPIALDAPQIRFVLSEGKLSTYIDDVLDQKLSVLPTTDEVLSIISKVNGHWQETHLEHGRAFWDNAAYHTGNMEVFRLTGDPEVYRYSEDWAKHNQWMGAKGTDKSRWKYDYGEDDDHALFGDWQICFQVYADLYKSLPHPQKIARAREVMEYEMSNPANDYWWWADGLYMVMPVMTKMYRLTGESQYLDKLHEYFAFADSIMWDEEAGLYYRDAKYVYPKHKSANGIKDFWARGDGWVLAGLAKVISDLPEAAPYRDLYIARYKRLAQAVAECQQPEGYWTRSLLDPEHAPGPETSGTAFFTYGLLWGINNGLLDEEVYLPVVSRAWTYLTEVALQPDGRIGYVQPIGEKAIPGQIVDVNSTANFGVGAFLLAACEMARYTGTGSYQLPKPVRRLVPVGLGYADTSVNTPIFRNSPITTIGDTQYTAYYDPEGYLTLAKRCLSDTVWTTARSQYRGNVTDGHNTISIMADGDGYLHVAFDHHGSPLHYARSVAPGSLLLGELTPMVGTNEDNVTYPEFYRMADGSLTSIYRDGASGQGNLVMNRYDTTTRQWQRLHTALIDGEGERNAYWQVCVDRSGTIHLSWVWRESWLVETNHDMCYARSRDGGRSWEQSDGTPYTLPITADNAEYACRIPQGSELINQTSMVADRQGRPYIATYWRDSLSAVPQYRIVWRDDDGWHQRQVGERTTPFTLSGGGTKMIPISRPRIVADGDGATVIYRDAERGSKVTAATCRNLRSGDWTVEDLTDFSVGAWEPSLDLSLLNTTGRIHIFVQETRQGDGERPAPGAPTPVYILEVEQ